MNLKMLNQTELDQRIKYLAQKEREILHEVLEAIKEIDTRKSYLELGFGSLFDYLVQGIGYSEGSAQRRIDAARLLREIPQMAAKIQSGEIKLSQISLVQKAVREVVKTQSVKVSAARKLEIVESICHKSHAQTQQEVAAFFDLPVIESSLKRVQADESVRVEFTLSKEAFAKIQRAQELLSHAVPTQDLAVFLEYLADKVIKQKTGIKISKIVTMPEKSDANVAVNTVLRATTKKALFQQQVCCQWKDPQTGTACQSKWLLQVDHKHSRWAGGSHDNQNLQLLCANHNKLKYRQEAGIRYLS